jgi:hypothetical protein
MTVRALAVCGGHPFEREPFLDLLGHLDGVECRHVEQPVVLDAPTLGDTDVVLLYDMPGLVFRPGELPALVAPPAEVVTAFESAWDRGLPFVALHHAIAAWPAWPAWAEFVGGRFHYVPADLRGEHWPDSGYAFGVRQRLTVLADHPVTAGLPHAFELVDETYLCPVLAGEVTPLVGTDAPLDDEHHASATAAVLGRRGERAGWRHPPGTPFAVWTKQHRASTVVYVQPGDGPEAYANPWFRLLLANALRWAATTGPGRERLPH